MEEDNERELPITTKLQNTISTNQSSALVVPQQQQLQKAHSHQHKVSGASDVRVFHVVHHHHHHHHHRTDRRGHRESHEGSGTESENDSDDDTDTDGNTSTIESTDTDDSKEHTDDETNDIEQGVPPSSVLIDLQQHNGHPAVVAGNGDSLARRRSIQDGHTSGLLRIDLDRILQDPMDAVSTPYGHRRRRRNNRNYSSPQVGANWNPSIDPEDMESPSFSAYFRIAISCVVYYGLLFCLIIIIITIATDTDAFGEIFGSPVK